MDLIEFAGENSKDGIKHCFVALEKVNIDQIDENSSSSFEDLPSFPFELPLRKSIKKSKMSVQELLEEHTSLAENLMKDKISHNNINEDLKSLTDEKYDESTDNPSSPVPTEIKFKIFCANDSLQFFNSLDVTLSQCGYKKESKKLTAFEKETLSFVRVELEHVLSSFFLTSQPVCISDCKSFITFLVRNLSVNQDADRINASYNALKLLLKEHPEASNVRFSSAEIFMFLFNYGVDIQKCQLLQKRPCIKERLVKSENQEKSRNKIPKKWTFNLSFILNSIMDLLSICKFKSEDLCNILLFFLWMSLDSVLLEENLFSYVQECILVCLEQVKQDKWNMTMDDVVDTVFSLAFPSMEEKWNFIYEIAESVPCISPRGIELRKQISFVALKTLFSENSEGEIDQNHWKFSLTELQVLLQRISDLESVVLSFAVKFANLCLSHLNVSEKTYSELCDVLKHCERALSMKNFVAKSHFAKIYARLKIVVGKQSTVQSTPHKVEEAQESTKIVIKVEKESSETAAEIYTAVHFIDNESMVETHSTSVKVKKEPVCESFENMDDSIFHPKLVNVDFIENNENEQSDTVHDNAMTCEITVSESEFLSNLSPPDISPVVVSADSIASSVTDITSISAQTNELRSYKNVVKSLKNELLRSDSSSEISSDNSVDIIKPICEYKNKTIPCSNLLGMKQPLNCSQLDLCNENKDENNELSIKIASISSHQVSKNSLIFQEATKVSECPTNVSSINSDSINKFIPPCTTLKLENVITFENYESNLSPVLFSSDEVSKINVSLSSSTIVDDLSSMKVPAVSDLIIQSTPSESGFSLCEPVSADCDTPSIATSDQNLSELILKQAESVVNHNSVHVETSDNEISGETVNQVLPQICMVDFKSAAPSDFAISIESVQCDSLNKSNEYITTEPDLVIHESSDEPSIKGTAVNNLNQNLNKSPVLSVLRNLSNVSDDIELQWKKILNEKNTALISKEGSRSKALISDKISSDESQSTKMSQSSQAAKIAKEEIIYLGEVESANKHSVVTKLTKHNTSIKEPEVEVLKEVYSPVKCKTEKICQKELPCISNHSNHADCHKESAITINLSSKDDKTNISKTITDFKKSLNSEVDMISLDPVPKKDNAFPEISYENKLAPGIVCNVADSQSTKCSNGDTDDDVIFIQEVESPSKIIEIVNLPEQKNICSKYSDEKASTSSFSNESQGENSNNNLEERNSENTQLNSIVEHTSKQITEVNNELTTNEVVIDDITDCVNVKDSLINAVSNSECIISKKEYKTYKDCRSLSPTVKGISELNETYTCIAKLPGNGVPSQGKDSTVLGNVTPFKVVVTDTLVQNVLTEEEICKIESGSTVLKCKRKANINDYSNKHFKSDVSVEDKSPEITMVSDTEIATCLENIKASVCSAEVSSNVSSSSIPSPTNTSILSLKSLPEKSHCTSFPFSDSSVEKPSDSITQLHPSVLHSPVDYNVDLEVLNVIKDASERKRTPEPTIIHLAHSDAVQHINNIPVFRFCDDNSGKKELISKVSEDQNAESFQNHASKVSEEVLLSNDSSKSNDEVCITSQLDSSFENMANTSPSTSQNGITDLGIDLINVIKKNASKNFSKYTLRKRKNTEFPESSSKISKLSVAKFNSSGNAMYNFHKNTSPSKIHQNTSPSKAHRNASSIRHNKNKSFKSDKNALKFRHQLFRYESARRSFKLTENISCEVKRDQNKGKVVCGKASESSHSRSYIEIDDDSDVEILYCDPKTYSDSDCVIVYESENLIVLD